MTLHFVRKETPKVEPKKKPVNERDALPAWKKSNVHLVREEVPKDVGLKKKPDEALPAWDKKEEPKSDVHFVRKEVPKEEINQELLVKPETEHEPLPPWDLNRPKEINVTASRK